MQWLVHTIRAVFARSTAAGVAVVATPVVLLAASVLFLVSRDAGESASTPEADPVSATYSTDVLAAVGTTPDAFVDGLITDLVTAEVPPDDLASVRSQLADAVDSTTSSAADVSDAVVRRLGPVATGADDLDELIGIVSSTVDPDGGITDTTDMIAAVRSWAAETTPHVLRVTSGAPPPDSIDLTTATFDDAVASLQELGSTPRVVVLGSDVITGLDALDLPGVSWAVDDAERSITFSASTAALGTPSESSIEARWDEASGPTWSGAIRTATWRPADVGFDGSFADRELETTVVFSETGGTVDAFGRTADVEPGVSILGRLERSALPDEVGAILPPAGSGTEPLEMTAHLGTNVAALHGSARPDLVTLTVTAPELQPPTLPTWLRATDEEPWAVVLTRSAETSSIGLRGGLTAELGGTVRTFTTRLDVAALNETASGRLVATMLDPWAAPFGLDWLTLEAATMTVDLDDGAGSATFDATASAAGHAATVRFTVGGGGDAVPAVDLELGIDRLSARETVGFLAATTGVEPPTSTPDVSIDDVLVDVHVSDSIEVAIGGTAIVRGREAEVVAAVEAIDGRPTILVGLAIDAWALPDLVPATAGTVLDRLEFPASALLLSSDAATLERSELSAPTRRFIDDVGITGEIELSPGVSLLTHLDLGGGALAAPLDALGYDGGRLPVVGTLPGTAIGGESGGNGNGSPLDDLSLTVRLPEIDPSNAPDWFRGGRLSLVATGAPSLALEGELDVRIDDEDLRFVVGAEFVGSGPGVELALFGRLATDRPWESPFGIDWLTVNDASLQLTIDPVGAVGLGFGGSIVIGERPIEVAIATELIGGVPTNFALQGESADGLALSDVVALQGAIASSAGAPPASLGEYPDLAVRDVEIRFAPQAFPRLGIDAGFALAGDVHITRGDSTVEFATLDLLIDETGVVAAGSVAGHELGPITWSDVSLDLALTSSSQRFEFDGSASLFGLTARATIELDAGSIFFDGRELLDDLRRAVDLFDALVDDPAGTLVRLPELFEAAGVPVPDWATAIVDAIAPLVERGVSLDAGAIDVILNGGTIRLPVSPPDGEEPGCHALPIRIDDRCYGTPPVPATDGLPAGGADEACGRLTPSLSGGRCYSRLPKGEVCLASWEIGDRTYGMQLRNGRCYAKVGRLFTDGYDYYPSGGLAPTIDRGVPSRGLAPVCLLETPVEIDGRCYTVPPTPAIPGIPDGGAAPDCRLFWTFEDGRCWRISPSQAGDGLGTPGVCSQFGIECRIDDLVRGRLAQTLFDGVLEQIG